MLSVLAFALALTGAASSARAQDIYVSDLTGNTISEYTLTGTPVATPLIDNLSNPFGIAVSGDELFEANYGVGTVKEYNADTGASMGGGPFGIIPVISTGLSYPADILLAGDDLYVANLGSGTVGLFNVTNGQPVGSSPFISSLNDPEYLALNDLSNNLLVSTPNAIYEYNAATGAPVGAGPLVQGLTNARGIAVNGDDLYVADATAGTVTVYDASTGSQIGAGPLISGLDGPRKIVYYDGDIYVSDTGDDSIMAYNAVTGEQVVSCFPVSCAYDFFISSPATDPVPEPSTWSLVIVGSLLVAFVRARSRRPVSIIA